MFQLVKTLTILNKNKHGVIFFAGTTKDTVYVNLNTIIHKFCFLASYPPLPAININKWQCVMSSPVYYNNG